MQSSTAQVHVFKLLTAAPLPTTPDACRADITVTTAGMPASDNEDKPQGVRQTPGRHSWVGNTGGQAGRSTIPHVNRRFFNFFFLKRAFKATTPTTRAQGVPTGPLRGRWEVRGVVWWVWGLRVSRRAETAGLWRRYCGGHGASGRSTPSRPPPPPSHLRAPAAPGRRARRFQTIRAEEEAPL